MSKESPSRENILTEGLIITVFKDDGPYNIYNSSPLSEEEAFSIAIKTLTAIGTNIPLTPGEIQSYGPFPTPRDPYLTFGFPFVLKAESTSDSRIAQFGRMIVFWIVTRYTATTKYIGFIKRMISRSLRIYQIKKDTDLNNENVLERIDEKIKIFETGIDTYYLTKEGERKPFVDLALIPKTAPIMLVDNTNKQIKLLLREKPTPTKKMELLQQTNQYKKGIHKGSVYKVEIITDSIDIQQLLSKSGIQTHTDVGVHYRIRLINELTFEELDNYFDFHFTPKRQQLITEVLKSIEKEKPLDIYELSIKIGISAELIEEFLVSAIKSGLIQNSKIENGIFLPQKEGGN